MTDTSRRDFLRGGFLRGLWGGDTTAPTPVERVVEVMDRLERPAPPPVPVLRPPGAVEEARFLTACTRCDACARACPHHAIVPAPARLRAAAGTPMIDPTAQACAACPDTPCITACEPGALVRAAEAPFPIMGTARILVLDCLAHQGTTCSSCSERCPIPNAIQLTHGRPTVVDSACVGCGVCASVCPAPRPAILITPRRDRPHG